VKSKFALLAILVLGLCFGVFLFLKDRVAVDSAVGSAAPATDQAGPTFSMLPVDEKLLIRPHSPIKGAQEAKVTVVEFLDPECESCSAMSPIVKKIYEEHKSEIRIVVRYMTFHKNSKYVANILEGTRAENKYWETLDLLFATQAQWADHQNPNPDLIPEILAPLKLDMKKIIADAKVGKYNQQIEMDSVDGREVGVRGTPTFFVNGRKLEELGYEALKTEIELQLGRK
jgi:protein-disulfide isomerase